MEVRTHADRRAAFENVLEDLAMLKKAASMRSTNKKLSRRARFIASWELVHIERAEEHVKGLGA